MRHCTDQGLYSRSQYHGVGVYCGLITDSEGVYPQNDGSLAIADIDASKGSVDLWVHFFAAIEDVHRNGY